MAAPTRAKLPGLALLLALPLALAAGTPTARASDFQASRPIRLVDGFPPGGPTDFLGRAMSPFLTEQLKQNIVMDNRPGAGGSIAAELVKNASPDGHTLMLTTSGTHAVNASIYAKLRYDPVRDFTHIALCASGANVLVVTPGLAATNVKDLIGLARAAPGELNFASSGVGTTVHLSAALFNAMAGVKTTHVPYKGAPEALTNVISGRVQFMVASISSALQMVRGGRLRAIGVTSVERHPALPDTPAIAETLPGFEAVVSFGVVGPAGLPPAVAANLNRVITAALSQSEVRTRLGAVGLEVRTSTPEAYAALVRSEVGKWSQVVKASGARAD